MRIVKAPDVRRAEILSMANQLFQTKGYSKTAVDEIVRQVGIAKGTFYHYFKSKAEILDALTDQLVNEMAIQAQHIANNNNLNAIEKLVTIIHSQNSLKDQQQNVVDTMHLPENRALHERTNIKIIGTFGPILAEIIQQGNQEQLFQVDDPLSTVQFILAGSLFLFGEGIFNWTKEQQQARNHAMLVIIERAFSAKKGSIVEPFTGCINHHLS